MKWLLMVGLVVGLSGCSVTKPETHHYYCGEDAEMYVCQMCVADCSNGRRGPSNRRDCMKDCITLCKEMTGEGV